MITRQVLSEYQKIIEEQGRLLRLFAEQMKSLEILVREQIAFLNQEKDKK